MKKVCITGTSRGIGLEIARVFKQANYHVIGISSQDHQMPELDQHMAADLSQETDINRVCEFIQHADIDVLVNNAGINIPDSFVDIKPQDFDQQYRVNLYAPFRLCQAVLPHMINCRVGRIVNISSIWGKISRARVASYSATKFGLDGLTLGLANEYARHNVLANCISPGFIDTDMTRANLDQGRIDYFNALTPVGRLGTPQEIANTVLWLADTNTFISGQNIAVDGGFTRA
jgi:3-oxoacyl-[acyl-carrier protein] reductase